uniref:Uncharacterized protein n=1 Tax=Pararge aegeria TaxID=116150 RepID=S4P3K0_9NEOP
MDLMSHVLRLFILLLCTTIFYIQMFRKDECLVLKHGTLGSFYSDFTMFRLFSFNSYGEVKVKERQPVKTNNRAALCF